MAQEIEVRHYVLSMVSDQSTYELAYIIGITN